MRSLGGFAVAFGVEVSSKTRFRVGPHSQSVSEASGLALTAGRGRLRAHPYAGQTFAADAPSRLGSSPVAHTRCRASSDAKCEVDHSNPHPQQLLGLTLAELLWLEQRHMSRNPRVVRTLGHLGTIRDQGPGKPGENGLYRSGVLESPLGIRKPPVFRRPESPRNGSKMFG